MNGACRGLVGWAELQSNEGHRQPVVLPELVEEFRLNAYAAAAASGREAELHAELEALVEEQNASSNDDETVIPAVFLQVTVSV